MKKKQYIVPTLSVVKVQYSHQLMLGSGDQPAEQPDKLYDDEVDEGW